MTTSRTSSRTTKADRPVLHAKKSAVENAISDPLSPSVSITHAELSRNYDGEERHTMIERLAYQYAESRGFAPGHDIDDWLSAESEVDARLMGERVT